MASPILKPKTRKEAIAESKALGLSGAKQNIFVNRAIGNQQANIKTSPSILKSAPRPTTSVGGNVPLQFGGQINKLLETPTAGSTARPGSQASAENIASIFNINKLTAPSFAPLGASAISGSATQGVGAPTATPSQGAAGTTPSFDGLTLGSVGGTGDTPLGRLISQSESEKGLKSLFDREFFDPMASFVEGEAAKGEAKIEDFAERQKAQVEEEAAARDRALEQRRESADQKKQAERNVVGMEQSALLSQIDRQRRGAFNQLRGKLADMGAFGTTGAGELDFGVLGEIYDGKIIDVKVAANKQLRDVEIAYWQIRESIESDQSLSDIARAQSIQSLNERALTEWQKVQSQKQDSIVDLAKEAYNVGAEEQSRKRELAAGLLKESVAQGKPITIDMIMDAGYPQEQAQQALDVIGKSADAVNGVKRLESIQSAIMPDFNVDENAIRRAANLLGIPFDELWADALRWAAAAKADYDAELAAELAKKGGGGGAGGAAGKKIKTQTPITDENNNVTGWSVLYTDGTSEIVQSAGGLAGGVGIDQPPRAFGAESLVNTLLPGLGSTLGTVFGGTPTETQTGGKIFKIGTQPSALQVGAGGTEEDDFADLGL